MDPLHLPTVSTLPWISSLRWMNQSTEYLASKDLSCIGEIHAFDAVSSHFSRVLSSDLIPRLQSRVKKHPPQVYFPNRYAVR